MTLPASGQISFNDLRVELGISTQSPFSITDAATNVYVTINTSSPSYPNSSAPHAISEWYSYNHNATSCANTYTISNVSGLGDLNAVCGAGTFNTNYSNCATLTAGCIVYTNSNCTGTYSSAYIQDQSSGLNWSTDVAGALVSSNPCV